MTKGNWVIMSCFRIELYPWFVDCSNNEQIFRSLIQDNLTQDFSRFSRDKLINKIGYNFLNKKDEGLRE